MMKFKDKNDAFRIGKMMLTLEQEVHKNITLATSKSEQDTNDYKQYVDLIHCKKRLIDLKERLESFSNYEDIKNLIISIDNIIGE